MNVIEVEELITLLLIFSISTVGAYVKDAHNTFTNKDEKFQLTRVLISSLVSTILIFSVSDILLEKMSAKLFILPCFIGGVIGFDLFEKINKPEFWLSIIDSRIQKSVEKINTTKK